ncbi:MAG: CPBP family intramembrane metalloprotease [Anaerolineae bacterium]|nr:CPBP family intramembrane metalloprotease [Anaerolineae bacterium]
MRNAHFIKQHPLALFFVISFVFTWPLIAVIIVATPPGTAPTDMPPFLFVLALLAGFSPSAAGFVATRISEGKGSVRALLGRLGQWRVSMGWYAVALLVPPFVSAATLVFYAALGRPAGMGDIAGRIAIGLIWPIFSSLGEEFGWRGFALPRLAEKHNALVSGLIIGIVWGMWHLPMDYIGMCQYGALFIPIFIIVGPVLMTAQSILMTWVYNNTGGSLLLMVLFHASITGSAIILSAPSLSAMESLWHSIVSAALYWLGAIIVIYTTGAKRLSRS